MAEEKQTNKDPIWKRAAKFAFGVLISPIVFADLSFSISTFGMLGPFITPSLKGDMAKGAAAGVGAIVGSALGPVGAIAGAAAGLGGSMIVSKVKEKFFNKGTHTANASPPKTPPQRTVHSQHLNLYSIICSHNKYSPHQLLRPLSRIG